MKPHSKSFLRSDSWQFLEASCELETHRITQIDTNTIGLFKLNRRIGRQQTLLITSSYLRKFA